MLIIAYKFIIICCNIKKSKIQKATYMNCAIAKWF